MGLGVSGLGFRHSGLKAQHRSLGSKLQGSRHLAALVAALPAEQRVVHVDVAASRAGLPGFDSQGSHVNSICKNPATKTENRLMFRCPALAS